MFKLHVLLYITGLPVPKDMDASVNNNESQVNPDTQHGNEWKISTHLCNQLFQLVNLCLADQTDSTKY